MATVVWSDIEYLRQGNERQRAAYDCLRRLGVFAALAAYRPTLVSTISIGIDVAASDLDIICEARDLAEFRARAARLYGARPDFKSAAGDGCVTAEFAAGGFVVELYAENRPVERQFAYRHLTVMARLLALGGETMRRRVRGLKRSGLKSEPAFAALLGLAGDPYAALLALEDESDGELRRLVAGAI